MCKTPDMPEPPPAPPPPPPQPEETALEAKVDPAVRKKRRDAARLGTAQLQIPLTSSLNIPK